MKLSNAAVLSLITTFYNAFYPYILIFIEQRGDPDEWHSKK